MLISNMEYVIVLNGTEVKKIKKNKKFSKIQNNPNMKILEECDLEQLEEKYNYWNRTLNREEEIPESNILKYKFKNIKTGEIISSIYPNLDNLKEYINVNDYESMV